MAKRTVLRSSTGKKLYAVRDAEGKFKDIQSYARAHAADLRGTATASDAAGAGKAASKKDAAKQTAAKQTAAKNTAAKKTARKVAKKVARKAGRK